MKSFFEKLFSSLDNHSLGYSGRKLTAVFSVIVAAYITIFLLKDSDRLHALYAWLTVALLCLGIVTIQNIIEFKNGKNDSKELKKEEPVV